MWARPQPSHPPSMSCAITGKWNMLVKARAASIEEIGKLVVGKIRELEGAYKAFTMACFDTIEEEP